MLNGRQDVKDGQLSGREAKRHEGLRRHLDEREANVIHRRKYTTNALHVYPVKAWGGIPR